MSVTIRPVTESDFFNWLELYAGYASFYDTNLTDEKALLLWSWLIDAGHEDTGIVAVAEDETLVGLAHFREFARPLETDRGLYLDDLFVAEAARGNGTGKALIDAVKEEAVKRDLGVVQWITATDNEPAQHLYDEVGTRTEWVTYEIAL
jgi:ribosomal protein S18 acetylase RimI-like enzyme